VDRSDRKALNERWLHDENPRALVAHWQVAGGLPAEPHLLAVLSLLAGQWPNSMTRGRVATVVDKERKAMVQALRRLGDRVPALVAARPECVG
jgi:hypothetical protein